MSDVSTAGGELRYKQGKGEKIRINFNEENEKVRKVRERKNKKVEPEIRSLVQEARGGI